MQSYDGDFLYSPTTEEIDAWYHKASQFKYVFQDFYYIPQFRHDIQTGLVHKMDNGIFYLTDVHKPIGNAYGHCIFWDRRTKGRGGYLRQLLKEGIKMFRLWRVTVVVPALNMITIRWLEKNGFAYEGVLRAFLKFDGKLCDAVIFAYYSDRMREYILTDELNPKINFV